MTVETAKSQEYNTSRTQENRNQEVQQEVRSEARDKQIKETNNSQKQFSQILASAQPASQVQRKAQEQISEGYLDVKV